MADVERNSNLQSNRIDKLKKRERIRLVLRTFFHSVCYIYKICLSVFAVIFCVQIYNHEIDKVSELSRYVWGFITNWNMEFQSIFLLLSVVYDVVEWRGKQGSQFGKRLRYYRDILFCAFVAPFTPFVVILFWSLYWINKELIYPSVFDDILPWWLNHCIHTNIIVIYLVEVILQPRRKPIDSRVEHWCVAVTGLLYTVVYYSIYFFAHRWLYNVFSVLTWWQIILLHTLCLAIIYAFYRLQYPLNRLFHKREKSKPKLLDVKMWATEENGKNGNRILTARDDSDIPFIDKSFVSIKDELEKNLKNEEANK